MSLFRRSIPLFSRSYFISSRSIPSISYRSFSDKKDENINKNKNNEDDLNNKKTSNGDNTDTKNNDQKTTNHNEKINEDDDIFNQDIEVEEEEDEEFIASKKQIHPYSIESGTSFYKAPFAYSAKILKRLSITGCALTTLLSPLIVTFGDPGISHVVRFIYSSTVFAFGLGTTGIVHLFVTPYVIEMKLLKNKNAKTKDDIPQKIKSKDNDENNTSTNENDDKESKNEQIKQEDENEESDDEEIEFEEFDLTGCSLEFTTYNILGSDNITVTDINELRVATNLIGTANFQTKEGKSLFIHEDWLVDNGHHWLLKHITRQRPQDITKDKEENKEENNKEENNKEEQVKE